MNKKRNQLRIIGGEWRSRVIEFPDAIGLRPTPARIRETLFNWLMNDIVGSCCLDLYSGSGILGFEAASRGAKKIIQIENNYAVYQVLLKNQQQLKAQNVSVIYQDAQQFLLTTTEQFDLVFCDPPFAKNLMISSCHLLEEKGCLSATAKIYIEMPHQQKLIGLPVNWECLKAKTAGMVDYYLFQIKS